MTTSPNPVRATWWTRIGQAIARRAPRTLAILTLLATQIGCDQASKEVAEHSLKGESPVFMLGGVLKFVYAENPGAFLGLGASFSPELRFFLFVLGVGFALSGALIFLLWKDSLSKSATLAGAFLLAGGFGNFIDRVAASGVVTDFVQLRVGQLQTGIFNIADVQIVVAAIVLVIVSVYAEAKHGNTSQSHASEISIRRDQNR